MTSQQRRRHIETARELARELSLAASRFDELALRDLDRRDFWSAMQLDPTLVASYRAFLERLWFDGIRSRFFAGFDASKLILPLAAEVADRLDAFVEALEQQTAGSDSVAVRSPLAAEFRIEN
jgi:broad specificity phosphatase PhoE